MPTPLIAGVIGYNLGIATVVMICLHHPVNRGKYTCPYVLGRDICSLGMKKLLTIKSPPTNKD